MISPHYEALSVEKKWYERWKAADLFSNHIVEDKDSYCVLMPPPNITGRLHMGHVLNNTLQDVLVRRKRMQGYVSCWIPGIDHASIATEAKVIEQLKNEGKSKTELGRTAFLERAWHWKKIHGDMIFQQLEQLGISCDWKRSCFTMDQVRSESVKQVFIRLHQQGYIYRGTRMVNWDPEARTALSDEEIYHKEVQGALYYINYPLDGGGNQSICVATTRPETLLGDVALCVHPSDPRFSHLQGRCAWLPLIGRSLPIIADEYVDPAFGTGCLKITPAHDPNDYLIGQKHGLEPIDILDEGGKITQAAGLLIGEDRFTARKKIVNMLKEKHYLRDVQAISHQVGFSERTHVAIEMRISPQWFCRMESLAKPALKAVLEGDICFYPAHQINTYRHWMENIKDWCISRQLWWGHRIPVWYTDSAKAAYVLGGSREEAYEAAQKAGLDCKKEALLQEEDVLDTWFSSWLWPLSVFDGICLPENVEKRYFYPTQDLVTGPDIIFFWVARMIMAGYAFTQAPPFQNVYFTGIVRDKQRRKMSKSLGNSPEPVDLIKKYGADGIRMGMMMCGKAGNDLFFDEALCLQGRNFANKLWNALRLVKTWESNKISSKKDEKDEKDAENALIKQAHRCIEAQLQALIHETEAYYEAFRLSDVAIALYKFIKEDFCNTYLELIKPPQHVSLSVRTLKKVYALFDDVLLLLHPFMPFITEEIWHQISDRRTKSYLMVMPYPTKKAYQERYCEDMEFCSQLVRIIHEKSHAYSKKEKEAAILQIRASHPDFYSTYGGFIEQLTGFPLTLTEQLIKNESYVQGVIGKDAFVLQGLLKKEDDSLNKKDNLIRKAELYAQSAKKLANQTFRDRAKPEVVQKVQQKIEDSLKIMKLLVEAGANLDIQDNNGQTALMLVAKTA